MLKLCPKCQLQKPESDFVSHRWCRDCKRAARKASYQRNRDKEITRAAVYNAAHPEMVAACSKRNYLKNRTVRLFIAQRTAARRRKIGFLLTFQEWLDFWGDKLALRGTRLDDLCMARHGDTGPYRIGNISIKTNRENLAERVLS
jgi:hypothetical protein